CRLRFSLESDAKGSVFEGYSLRPKPSEISNAYLFQDGLTLAPIDRTSFTFRPIASNPEHREILRELKRSACLSPSLSAIERRDFWIDLRIDGSLEPWSLRWLNELPAEQSVPELVHTLICLARCPLPKDSAPKLAAALLSLDEKLEKSKAATD